MRHPRLLPIVLLTLLAVVSASAQSTEDPVLLEQQLEEQWVQSKTEHGESHASGMRPELGPVILGNPTQAVVTLRVGLHWSFNASGAFSEFASRNHPFAEISNTAGDAHVLDRATGKKITTIVPGMIVRVSYNGTGYQVALDGAPLGTFAGPIFFRPTDITNQFRVESIRRAFITTQVPRYRGAIEVTRGTATAANTVNVVNVVEVEDYVPGVVANESLASFHIEALKAQAIAARGYAIANVGRFQAAGWPFDIVDSSTSQVYRGVISEDARVLPAASQTLGLVASHEGQIITALYSSSFGGHSESNEWIFNIPDTQLPGSNATAYLRGIYDGHGTPPPDFSSEAGVSAFWKDYAPPNAAASTNYDDCVRVNNRFSRWRIVMTAAQIKSRLPGRFFPPTANISGTITDVAITQRMGASGRAAVARITLTTDVVEVRGWDNLRNVLGRSVVSTPALCTASPIAANFTLNNPSVLEVNKNADGTVNNVVAWGGGWGHNVGMSQFGSQGRARAGQNFVQILKAYYTGSDIGAYPIDIGREPGTGVPTLRQQFYAPNARGTLVIRPENLKGLRVHINDTYDLSFSEEDLATGVVTGDVSAYLVPGINTIQYNSAGRDGKATVTVLID